MSDRTARRPDQTEEPAAERRPALLDQMGGLGGIAASSLPVVVFIVVNVLTGLVPALLAAIGSAVAVAGWRLVRREGIQPAISGLLGVVVCAFIAYRTGSARGFFLFGIWTSLLYGSLFLASVLIRWPLVGVIWHGINGEGQGWRRQARVVRGYDLATLTWTAVFAARFVVQRWLYNTDQAGWLAGARLAMGYPLTVLALLVTFWAARRARRAVPPG